MKMKLLFISDIHGSPYYLKEALRVFEEDKFDYLIILGDILYHGARNPLSPGHNPEAVIKLLNYYKEKIIAVRGNCDSEVDDMVLDFPIMAEYSNLLLSDRRFFLHHGHIYNEYNMPALEKGDVFIYGHTHIPEHKERKGILFFNPGSISLPKAGHLPSYGSFKDNEFSIIEIKDE